MRMLFTRLAVGLSTMFLLVGVSFAGEKKLMHCFYFTPIKDAAEADWQAFFKATDALPGQIPGLEHVWYGKLNRSLTLFNTDAETRKKLAAGEAATGPVTPVVREFGVCMEFTNAAALKTYATHGAHDKWNAAYSKVRQYGTTTIDFMGQ